MKSFENFKYPGINTIRRKMENKPISMDEFKELDLSTLDSKVDVQIGYQGVTYICTISPLLQQGDYRVSMAVKPTGYQLEGSVYFNEHEPTEFGEKVTDYVSRKKLGVDFSKEATYYIREIDSKKEHVAQIYGFVKDVAKLIPEVDKMILDYLYDDAA